MSKKQKKPRAAATRPVTTRQVTEVDPNGIEITHHRTVDTLGLMLDSGAITAGMHAAARDFQAAFTIACFDNMPKVNLNLMARSPSAAYHVGDFSDAQVAARERVGRALDALGGHSSPAGSCVWHVSASLTGERHSRVRSIACRQNAFVDRFRIDPRTMQIYLFNHGAEMRERQSQQSAQRPRGSSDVVCQGFCKASSSTRLDRCQ